jgi:hypothetical protein
LRSGAPEIRLFEQPATFASLRDNARRGIGMVRTRLIFPSILILSVMGSPGFAESTQPLPPASEPAAVPHKVPPKKSAHAKADPSTLTLRLDPKSEEAKKAATLAEGRKKFFEQSTGFTEKSSDNSLSLGGSEGTSPQMGFKF